MTPGDPSREYGGPGGRVSSRTTRVSDPATGGGIGAPGDGFVLEYLYDVWGNVNSVKHPRWSPWDLLCPTATEVESLYAYDDSGDVRSFGIWSA